MKHYLILLALAFVMYAMPLAAFAQETTETPQEPVAEVAETSDGETQETSEEDAIKQKILDLKERLATRVAEIQEQNKRAFFGVIKEKSDSKLTLLYDEEEQLVALDPSINVYTKENGEDKESDSIDSLELGQSVSVFGTLDLDQKTLVAANAIVQELPKKTHGVVLEVDTDANTFTVDGTSGVTVLDYEISTRCTVYEDNETDTCGLTKITVGDMVFVRMTPEDDDLSSAKALRVLLVTQEVEESNQELDESNTTEETAEEAVEEAAQEPVVDTE